MRARFLVTTPLSGVVVTAPSPRAVWFLMHGGRWPWRPAAWREDQIARQIADGIPERVAVAWVKALHAGGLTEADALWLIAERDALRHGTALEIVDISDIPTDRTYRNAWRRSMNGGPIYLDEEAVVRIDEERLWRAYEQSKGTASLPGW